MAIREGRWDCIYCEARAIRGRHMVCPNCQRARPAGVKFYLPENAEEIQEEFLIERANIGPDWICPFCESSNASDATVCQRCMAPKGTEVTEQNRIRYAVGQVAREGDLAAQEKAAYEPEEPVPTPAPKKRSSRQLLMVAGILFALLCLCGSLAFFLFRGNDASAVVTDVRWERSIAVQEYGTVTEEGWSLPAGGRIVDQYEDIRAYEQVQVGTETVEREVSERVQVGEREYVCGQEDLGNGFFEDVYCTEPVYETQYHTETFEEPVYEDQPIYDTYYVFEIDTWSTIRTESASGTDFNLFWPAVDLNDEEREGDRQATYITVFQTSDGDTYEVEHSEDEWRQYAIGDEVTLEIDSFGNVTDVSPP